MVLVEALFAATRAKRIARSHPVIPAERSIVLSALRLVLVMGAGVALFSLAARFLGITELKLLSSRYRAMLR